MSRSSTSLLTRLSFATRCVHAESSTLADSFKFVLPLLLSAVAYPGYAMYLSNYSTWRELSDAQKESYSAGLYDAYLFAGTSNDEAARVHGTSRCGVELKITPNMIVDAIDAYYEKDTSNWDKPPILGFHESIGRGACLKFINEERAKYGLDPW